MGEPSVDKQDVISPPAESYDHDVGREEPSPSFVLRGMVSEDVHMYLAVEFAASFILMSQAASILDKDMVSDDEKGKVGYAVAVGVFGILLSALAFVIERKQMDSKIKQIVAIFNGVWWLTALWLTFAVPFQGFPFLPSWIALWAGGVSAFFYMLLSSPLINARAEVAKGNYQIMHGGRKLAVACGLSSLVVMIQSSIDYADGGHDTGGCANDSSERAYAIALGTVGFVLGAVCFAMASRLQPFMKFIAGFLVVWWGIGLLIILGIWDTDCIVYVSIGNGFLGTVVALFSATGMFISALTSGGSLDGAEAEATV